MSSFNIFFFNCREVFADFDPIAVAKLNEKKLTAPGSVASSLISELKLRAIIENARQISKVNSLRFDVFYLFQICTLSSRIWIIF